jgi:hypothetical protein
MRLGMSWQLKIIEAIDESTAVVIIRKRFSKPPEKSSK